MNIPQVQGVLNEETSSKEGGAMNTLKENSLVSPCVNSKGVVCPRRKYPSCMSGCPPMQEFKDRLHKEPCYMSSTSCEHGPDLPIIFQTDGVANR